MSSMSANSKKTTEEQMLDEVEQDLQKQTQTQQTQQPPPDVLSSLIRFGLGISLLCLLLATLKVRPLETSWTGAVTAGFTFLMSFISRHPTARWESLITTALCGGLFWALSHPTPGPSATGLLVAHSNAPQATLFFRQAGAPKWHYVDCTPQVNVVLAPGRYQMRIEGVGGRVIVQDREVEILAGQQADLAPDG